MPGRRLVVAGTVVTPGGQDDRCLRKLCAQHAGQPESALTGHLDIAEDHRCRIGGHDLEALLRGIGFDGRVSDGLDPPGEELPYGSFVIDDQDMV